MRDIGTRALRIAGGLGAVLAVALGAFVVWGSTPLGPGETAVAALRSDHSVTVTDAPWLAFVPVHATPTTGLILYPGGRVDPRSYAPLARGIADEGALVVVVPMPLNLAVFAPDRAGVVMDAYPQIETWAIGGHSLGGAMAARYVDQRQGTPEGLILWAAYPASTNDLSGRDDLAALSIYATRDGLMTGTELTASRLLLPDSTCWRSIQGGNHAQFGDYGPQGRDNAATIAPAEQRAQIVAVTAAFLNQLSAVGDAGFGDFDCSGIADSPEAAMPAE